MSAMKRQLSPRLVSVTDRNGDVIYDPMRQPQLHAAQMEQRIKQAEETNAVFRAAAEKRPVARKRRRFWLTRALVAVGLLWDVRIAR